MYMYKDGIRQKAIHFNNLIRYNIHFIPLKMHYKNHNDFDYVSCNVYSTK